MKKRSAVSRKEFRLLLSFLGDGSETTVALARQQVEDLLRRDPDLESVVRRIADSGVKRQAENLVETVRLEDVEREFRSSMATPGDIDLEQALFLLARLAFPRLTPSDVAAPLDALAADVDRAMAEEPALPTRAVHGLGRFLFQVRKFATPETGREEPEHLLLNRVIERESGMGILIGCVYLLVGRRLGLLVHGVALPGRFIVAHRLPRGVVYLDPSQEGRILRKKDCEVIVRKTGIAFKEEFLDGLTHRQILSRVMVYLINLYTERGAVARAQTLAYLFGFVGE
jgi:regulator of sirC expression with transglutaminase-like and TPR domain